MSYSSRDSPTWVVTSMLSMRAQLSVSSYISEDALYGGCGLRPRPPVGLAFSEKNNQEPKADSSIQGCGRTSINSKQDHVRIGLLGRKGKICGFATMSRTVVVPFRRSSANPSCVARM